MSYHRNMQVYFVAMSDTFSKLLEVVVVKVTQASKFTCRYTAKICHDMKERMKCQAEKFTIHNKCDIVFSKLIM